ncbi:hypothetical protein [Mycoplasma phocimorsus]|uniref:hypothetical protein n=1 Tax=Mycoplasma phocimorsus TaxID=3045839 RepID=UPI0024BF7AD8|nr:hypothetical protein [Mycoplasma phocimorsus]MDJ1647286.1 hypothetical protein [Mycoplasma phocimorsus]
MSKKNINIILTLINIALLSNAISCNVINKNNQQNKNNVVSTVLKNNKNRSINYNLFYKNILTDKTVNSTFNFFNKNKKIANSFYANNNEDFFIESNLIEEKQKHENYIQEEIESIASKNIFKNLLEKRKKHQEKMNYYKKIMIGFGIASAIVVGISSSLGIYSGIKNDAKNVNLVNKSLEEQIKIYKNLYKEINQTDPFTNVIVKVIDIAFTKQLPQAILNFLKETILKESFQKIESNLEEELIKKLAASKEATEFAVKDLLTKFTKLEIKNIDNKEFKKSVKKAITDIIKNYLPDLIKGILDFLTIQGKAQSKNSILADFLIKKLENWRTKLQNSDIFSKIIRIYIELIIEKNNKLISFLINKASDAINKTNLSFNIIDDIFTIVNTFIEILILKENETKSTDKIIDVEKIIKVLLPELVNSIEIDDSKDYSVFVFFVNGMFEKNNANNSNNNNNLWVYNLIDKNKFQPENTSYLEMQNSSQFELANNRKIIIPELDLSIDDKFLVLLELNNISGFITKLFNLLFEPLVIELKKNENNKHENAKKAITRLTGLISYIYYKLSSNNESGFFNKLKKDLTPADPKYAIPKTISKLLTKHGIKKIELTDLFGKEVFDSYLYIFSISSYKIFSESKKQVKENSELKKIFEEGNFK